MGTPRKILIVDDDSDYRFLLERDLEKSGFEILSLESGEQVCTLAASEHPDVILLDIGLPGKSGWEVLEQLQQSIATAGIPVVMLTGHDDSDDVIRGYSSGASYFIGKPHEREELLRGIEIAISNASDVR